MKRQGYISWDEYFMGIALLAAKRSKDPNTQVGACIVSPENIIISTGYNGLPNGCSDDEFPWEREGGQTKYPFVVSLITMWGVRIFGTMVCVRMLGLGLEAVWLCMVGDNVSRALLLGARYFSGRWKRSLDLDKS